MLTLCDPQVNPISGHVVDPWVLACHGPARQHLNRNDT
jgi:hypothetical protein